MKANTDENAATDMSSPATTNGARPLRKAIVSGSVATTIANSTAIAPVMWCGTQISEVDSAEKLLATSSPFCHHSA